MAEVEAAAEVGELSAVEPSAAEAAPENVPGAVLEAVNGPGRGVPLPVSGDAGDGGELSGGATTHIRPPKSERRRIEKEERERRKHEKREERMRRVEAERERRAKRDKGKEKAATEKSGEKGKGKRHGLIHVSYRKKQRGKKDEDYAGKEEGGGSEQRERPPSPPPPPPPGWRAPRRPLQVRTGSLGEPSPSRPGRTFDDDVALSDEELAWILQAEEGSNFSQRAAEAAAEADAVRDDPSARLHRSMLDELRMSTQPISPARSAPGDFAFHSSDGGRHVRPGLRRRSSGGSCSPPMHMEPEGLEDEDDEDDDDTMRHQGLDPGGLSLAVLEASLYRGLEGLRERLATGSDVERRNAIRSFGAMIEAFTQLRELSGGDDDGGDGGDFSLSVADLLPDVMHGHAQQSRQRGLEQPELDDEVDDSTPVRRRGLLDRVGRAVLRRLPFQAPDIHPRQRDLDDIDLMMRPGFRRWMQMSGISPELQELTELSPEKLELLRRLERDEATYEDLLALEDVERGAEQGDIDALPSSAFVPPKDEGGSGVPPVDTDVTGTSSHTCSICLEQYVAGDPITEMPCFHLFHTICINTWLQTSKLCPICRVSMLSRPAPGTPRPQSSFWADGDGSGDAGDATRPATGDRAEAGESLQAMQQCVSGEETEDARAEKPCSDAPRALQNEASAQNEEDLEEDAVEAGSARVLLSADNSRAGSVTEIAGDSAAVSYAPPSSEEETGDSAIEEVGEEWEEGEEGGGEEMLSASADEAAV